MLVLVHPRTCILDLQDGVAAGCYVGDDAQKECGVLPNMLVKGKLKHACMEPGQEPQRWGKALGKCVHACTHVQQALVCAYMRITHTQIYVLYIHPNHAIACTNELTATCEHSACVLVSSYIYPATSLVSSQVPHVIVTSHHSNVPSLPQHKLFPVL